MLDFVAKYWLEALFGGILAALSFAVKRIWGRVQAQQAAAEKLAQDKDAERIAIREAVLALLHDRLYSLARYYLDRGWVTIQDLDNLEYLYTAYHALGGNGTGTELFERCKALPIKPMPIAPVTEQE